MADSPESCRLPRRDFLKGLGCLAGSLAVAPFDLTAVLAAGSGVQPHSPSYPPLKIGVLLPRSSIYPALGDHLLKGMALGFEPSGRTVTFLSEDIGFGAGLAAEKARRMVEDGVDLVVGVVSSGVVSALRDVFRDGPAPLLAANVGANVLREDEQNPNVFHHSLGLWRANWALGRWAADQLGARGLIASSFYDSGYDSLHAFQLGFEAGNGAVLDTRVTHVPPSREDFAGVLGAVGALRPDFVYASYCGPEAVDFVNAYAGAGLAGHVPLIGSAFLTDEGYLPAQGQAALGVRTCFSWSPALDIPANRQFAASYHTQTGQIPDAFAALGFDTSCLVCAALDAAASAGATELRPYLAEAEWNGLSGWSRMDRQTQASTGPVYLREVQVRGGHLANVALAEIGRSPVQVEHFQAVRASLKTGWLNAYLSV